ncbi:MAG: RbsD/FucU domain-containing protein, partial [Beijerinckiaceae bacterium]
GIPVERAVAAVLTLFPVDGFTTDPIRFMQPVDAGAPEPVAITGMKNAVRTSGYTREFTMLERFAFYGAARSAFGIVQCGDPRFYGNILIRKGAIEG